VTPIGALLAEVLSLPHVWHVREFGDRDFGLHYDWGEYLFRKFMSRADAAVAVSKAVRKHVLSEVDVPCRVVYNGVISQDRLEKLEETTRLKKDNSPSSYTFAIVGKISPAKGQEQALRALHRLGQEGKEACLLVAGSGNRKYEESLRRFCKSRDLEEAVSFLGYVSDPFEVYQRADAVLMCSPHEAMGRVTAEAMAAGRPVIGYESDGTIELIENKHNGLLYNGTTNHLAKCMNNFIDNKRWAYSLGENGRKKARKKYTNEIYVEEMYKILQGLKK
jgi:glycosyltransferase involved in cell wall biosynthesis